MYVLLRFVILILCMVQVLVGDLQMWSTELHHIPTEASSRYFLVVVDNLDLEHHSAALFRPVTVVGLVFYVEHPHTSLPFRL